MNIKNSVISLNVITHLRQEYVLHEAECVFRKVKFLECFVGGVPLVRSECFADEMEDLSYAVCVRSLGSDLHKAAHVHQLPVVKHIKQGRLASQRPQFRPAAKLSLDCFQIPYQNAICCLCK